MKMVSKIEELQIKNAKTLLLKKMNFLGIKNIFSKLDEKGDLLFSKYKETGIYRYENKAIASFEFHHNGRIDTDLKLKTHQKARAIFKEKFLNLAEKSESIYILLIENGKSFWVEIDFLKLYENLDKLWQEKGDFVVFSEDFFALDIHQAEYEWEVLQWVNPDKIKE